MVGPAFALVPSSLSAGLLCAALAAVAALMGWATWAQRDLWPFSHYPMFGKATAADAAQFFVLRFRFPDGRTRGLGGAGEALADAFHREFARLREASEIAPAASDAAVRRYWREASSLDPRLAGAAQADVTLRIGKFLPGDDLAVMAKVVLTVTLPGPDAQA